MADMGTALNGGYADAYKDMLDPQAMADNDPAQYYQKTPFMKSLWQQRLPTWLGQAYEQDIKPAWDAYEPQASDLYNAPISMAGALADDVAQKTQSVATANPNDPESLRQASESGMDLMAGTNAAGGLVSRAVGMPKGAVLGANVWQGGPNKYGRTVANADPSKREGTSAALQHMGEGEGAQAYGWGDYRAQAQDVGQQYKEALSGRAVRVDGRAPDDSNAEHIASLAVHDYGSKGAANLRERAKKESFWGGKNELTAKLEEAADIIESPDSKMLDVTYESTGGYLYKHDLPDEDIARYLDWDAPLSEQPESVRKALAQSDIEKSRLTSELAKLEDAIKAEASTADVNMNDFDAFFSTPNSPKLDDLINQKMEINDRLRTLPSSSYMEEIYKNNPDMTGRDFYNLLENNAGRIDGIADPNRTKIQSKQKVSEALGKAGIPGLKYYDGMSRTPGFTSLKTADLDARISSLEADLKTGLGQPEVMERQLKSLKGERARHDEANRTRNFVTWDQDVLDRMKLLERNGVDMTQALMGAE